MEQSLDRFGYEIIEKKTDDIGFFQELSARKRNDQILFILERLPEQFVDNYSCRAKMVGRSKINTKFVLERKLASYGTTIKSSGILDDYLITSENQQEISEFLAHERIFPLFEDLIENSLDKKVEVNAANGSFLIRLKTNCDFTLALRSIPTLESLTWIFEGTDSFEMLISGIGKYSCDNCEAVVTLEDTKCPNCGKQAPRCMICLRDPQEGELIVQMECCSTYVHQKELQAWIVIKLSCPYCRTESPGIHSVDV